MEALPLTPEKLKKSRDSVETAFFILGKSLQDYVPDYRTAINIYDSLQIHYPDTRFYQESLYNQYFCYIHLNDSANAARILALLKTKFSASRYIALIENPPHGPADLPARTLATRAYEKVYDHLIEGKFDVAAAEKLQLDSIYGEKYWTPQLLYIEALYYIHYRYDSIGKVTLNKIITKYSGTEMASKAKNVLRVLNERERIENYLRNLKVTRLQDDSIAKVTAVVQAKSVDSAAALAKAKALTTKMTKDSNQFVMKPPDLLQLKAQSLFVSPFLWSPEKGQSIVLVMTRVDPVYVTESKNAFDRYNRENFNANNYITSRESLTDTTKMMIIQGFKNTSAALAYLKKAGAAAGREIIPWLPATKYFFILIDDYNLEILKANKNISLYQKFLNVYSPDQFPAVR